MIDTVLLQFTLYLVSMQRNRLIRQFFEIDFNIVSIIIVNTMAQVPFLDNLLKEYLTYRGLSNTLKALDAELKNERDQSFQADKIMDQFMQYIQTHDLNALLTLWQHLDTYLFTKLDHNYVTGK